MCHTFTSIFHVLFSISYGPVHTSSHVQISKIHCLRLGRLFVLICAYLFLFVLICSYLRLFVLICSYLFLFALICSYLFLFVLICAYLFLFVLICAYLFLFVLILRLLRLRLHRVRHMKSSTFELGVGVRTKNSRRAPPDLFLWESPPRDLDRKLKTCKSNEM